MIWQDIVISIANIIFIFSLIEQLYENLKKKASTLSLITCFFYAGGLYAMTIAMFTLNLYFSSAVTLINAILWSLLGIQSLVYNKNLK